ncbi:MULTISPECIES: hypothetical protein [unclassified Fibrobacter]|uniref:hypothetical protein n=1 Tax=unclassified Fibrobacter TaxID=2634177 RepID=UPI000917BEE6|nr:MULTISPECIES: hypothetical protein [unclassified Fibrobacter]OWV05273.1 hypothetical protein B7993_08330 [Fibrobacter sp. UWH3]SHL30820.1 hypothetical protein SAMN05720765_112132 [Fibrobacter sp. UWH6]
MEEKVKSVMNLKEFKKCFWNTFRSIENELLDCSRYVAIDALNYACYSQAFLKLLLQIGSEIDVVSRVFCNVLDGDNRASNIDQYRDIILKHYPDFDKVCVVAKDCDLLELPWNDWKSSNPAWWRIYNKVKHDRLGIDDRVYKTELPYYKEANLQNVITGLMALYQIEAYIIYLLMKKENKKDVYSYKASSLFALDGCGWKKEDFYKEGEIICKDEGIYIPMED